MKLKLLGASALLAVAFALTAAPAAIAGVPPENIYLVTTINGIEYCLPNVPHGQQAYVTDDVSTSNCSPIHFLGEQVTPNGNAWWELQMSNGNCLNWVPYNGTVYYTVYSDSCVDDWNELWFNHNAGQLINLEGNSSTGQDTSLVPNNSSGSINNLYAFPDSDYIYSAWSEQTIP
jgi:hypothetical protein